MRWSERRTAVRSAFEMTSTLSLRATRRPRPPSLILFSLDRETQPSISFSRLRHLRIVDRIVHRSASASRLPGTVGWRDAVVGHPVGAARYDLVFRLRFHRHISLPRIFTFSRSVATLRVGACRHFVHRYSHRHDFRRTHDLCPHTPGGQFRVHANDLTRQ